MIETASRAASTEERLVDGALQSIKEKGLAATSSRDIAAASGVNLAGITYHFGSKDELVAEALLRAARRWLEPVIGALSTDAEPATRLLVAIEALHKALEDAGDLVPVYIEARVQSRRADRLKSGLDALVEELRQFIADQLAEQRASGYLPEWVDAQAMAGLLIAVADGIALHVALDPDVDHRAIAAQAVQLLLAARG
jgi:AcrR family transcriptional regulator